MSTKVYQCSQEVFSDREDLLKTIIALPAFSLCSVVPVRLGQNQVVYQLTVYCFDDEVDISDYTPVPF